MSVFQFKHFQLKQTDSALKMGTDAMVLGAFCSDLDFKKALDVGAGTGVLALMLAQSSKGSIDAIEIDEKSANEARFNFEQSNWSQRLRLIHQDFQSFTSEDKYDLIISNPPYYESTLKGEDARKASSKHVDNLTPQVFAKRIASLLNENGICQIIVPFETQQNWVLAFEVNQFFVTRKIIIRGKKSHHPNRVILQFSYQQKNKIESIFVIRNEDGSYTSDYIELTKEFHSKLVSK